MENTMQKISWEQVKELLPETVSLYYVDYRDDLENCTEEIQKSIHEQCIDALYERVGEAYIDSPFYAFEYIDKEIKSDMVEKFEIDEDEADELFELYRDEIREVLYDRDDSTLMDDLWRNTRKFVMFYSTGYEMEPDSWSWNKARVKQERTAIKKYLGIKGLSEEEDYAIDQMIMQATYGGELVIFFREEAKDFIDTENVKSISFSDANIAIVDNCNGSGDHCQISTTITLPFKPGNIFLDKNINYSYTYDICGMSDDWCEGTHVQLSTKEKRKRMASSKTAKFVEQDAAYEKTFKEGKCTLGDTKFSRHRNTVYINEYPCGTHCKDCGQFWID
jgi:hypothetical protein